jgi:hypothetical protein
MVKKKKKKRAKHKHDEETQKERSRSRRDAGHGALLEQHDCRLGKNRGGNGWTGETSEAFRVRVIDPTVRLVVHHTTVAECECTT